MCDVSSYFSLGASFSPHMTSEMAEEADLWKRLLLDGPDRQGGGERVALAGRD